VFWRKCGFVDTLKGGDQYAFFGGPQGRAREQPMATLPCPLDLVQEWASRRPQLPLSSCEKEKQELAAPPIPGLGWC